MFEECDRVCFCCVQIMYIAVCCTIEISKLSFVCLPLVCAFEVPLLSLIFVNMLYLVEILKRNGIENATAEKNTNLRSLYRTSLCLVHRTCQQIMNFKINNNSEIETNLKQTTNPNHSNVQIRIISFRKPNKYIPIESLHTIYAWRIVFSSALPTTHIDITRIF